MDSELRFLLVIAKSEGFPEELFADQIKAYDQVKKAEKALMKVQPERSTDKERSKQLMLKMTELSREFRIILGDDAASYARNFIKLEQSKEEIRQLKKNSEISESKQMELFPIFEV